MKGHSRAMTALLMVTVFVFITGAMVALLWIPLEIADAVVDDAVGTWFVPVVLISVSGIIIAAVTVKRRTRGWIALTASAAVLLVCLGLTYPSTSVVCPPGATDTATPSSGGQPPFTDEDLSGLVEEPLAGGEPSTGTDTSC